MVYFIVVTIVDPGYNVNYYNFVATVVIANSGYNFSHHSQVIMIIDFN